MWYIFYGKEGFLNSKLLELVHFWYGTPTNVRWNLNRVIHHIQEADGEMGGANHGVEEVDFDIDYTTLCIGRDM